MVEQLRVVANLAKVFHIEGRGELGRLPFSRICYIVAREMKHKLKVSWDIIVYNMQTLLTGSNEPGPGSIIFDFDLATLDDIRYHRILYTIVYYFILERKSSFQPKCHCSQHFQFSVKNFQTIVSLVFIDWYHLCTYIDYASSFISYNFKVLSLSVIYTAFDTNFYEDRKFS